MTDKGKGKGKAVRRHFMIAYGGVEVLTHSLLALALDGVEWSWGSRLGRFTPEKSFR